MRIVLLKAIRLTAVLGSVAAFALAVGASAASAAGVGVAGFFGASGSEAGQVSGPSGLAVDPESEDVVVVDRYNNRVDVFTGAGEFVRAFGWGVENGAAQLQVCTSATTCQRGTSGAGAGELSSPVGVAVEDALGTADVYVTDQSNRRIDEFTIEGAFVRAFGWGVEDGTAALQTCTSTCEAGLSGAGAGELSYQVGYPAIAPAGSPNAGDLYVADKANHRVQVFTAAGGFVEAFGWGVADGAAELEVCTLTCEAGLSGAGSGELAAPNDVAVAGDGSPYVVDTSNRNVQRFDATAKSAIFFAGAQLSGEASPEFVAFDATSGVVYATATASSGSERHVLQFDASGVPLATELEGAGVSSLSGLALDAATGVVYVSAAGFKLPGDSYATGVLKLGPNVAPTATIQAAGAVSAAEATLHGEVDPTGLITGYEFEYSANGGASWTVTPEGVVQAGAAEPVSETVTGLEGSAEYTVRLLAAKPFGAGDATSSETTFVTSAAAPEVTTTPARDIAAVEATLGGEVNPENQATSYWFEYGTSTEYGASVPTSPVTLDAAGASIRVQEPLSGLAAGVTYHYRLVAKNATDTTDGLDETFSTYPASATQLTLPDARGYEKVSPTDNNDANVYAKWPVEISNEGGFTYLPYEAARNGNAIAYVAQPSAEGGVGREGGGAGNEYVAHRNAEGRWEASNVLPPSEQVNIYPDYQAFSPNITQGLLTTNSEVPLVPGAVAEGYDIPYARDFETGAYTSLLPIKPPNRTKGQFTGSIGFRLGGKSGQPVFAAATADFSHILYMANDALTPNAVDGGQAHNNLYDFTGGGLQLVNVLPDGSPEPAAVFGGPIEAAERGDNGPDFDNVISTDGSRIFWTGEGANPNIYMREDGAKTVQVDAGAGGGGHYLTATPSGSKVLFTKEGSLYEYDVETEATSDLAASAEVQGLIGTSEDLSYIYFVANAQLGGAPQQGDCTGEFYKPGECNLYVLHVGDPVRYIATLADKDNRTEPKSFGWVTGDWRAYLGSREAAVTPSGDSALFSSVIPLTNYDNQTVEGPAPEFYVYEYSTRKLRCVSCNRSGAPAEGVVSPEGRHFPYSSFLPSSFAPSYSLHWMSSDGSRVFFDSVEALVPQDKNHTWDVYEWEQDGSGTCTEAEGCVYLISGGTPGEGNFLVDVSESGNDVFFTTRAKLVAEDENENVDLYDAHVGAAPPPVAPRCSGAGCQGVPSAPPAFATPPSVTFSGVGNLQSRRAHKGKKAHGRCGVRQAHKGKARRERRSKVRRKARGKHHRKASRSPRCKAKRKRLSAERRAKSSRAVSQSAPGARRMVHDSRRGK